MAFRAGVSGNPSGRPKGIENPQAKLRRSIEQHIPDIIAQLVEQAKHGDAQAARLLIERVLPPIKASEQPQVIPIPGATLTEQGMAVLDAVSTGTLAPSQGSALITAIGQLAKISEIDALEKRISAIEIMNPRSFD